MLAACKSPVSQSGNMVQTEQTNEVENSTQAPQAVNVSSFITMSRSACFGSCPVYTLTIQPNGKAVFEGIQHTEVKGKVESNLNEKKINMLIAEIEKADFFSFKDSYEPDSGNCPESGSDTANVVISIKLTGREKTVLHNQGCVEISTNYKVFPQQLYKLENKIDEIVETKRWIGEGK